MKSELSKEVKTKINRFNFAFMIHINSFIAVMLFLISFNIFLFNLPILVILVIAICWIAGIIFHGIKRTAKISNLKADYISVVAIPRKSLHQPELRTELTLTPIPLEKKEETQPKKKKESKELVTSLSKEELKELIKTESEVNIEEREITCIVHKGKIKANNIYLCPKCNTFYCVKCARVLKNNNEHCWSCSSEIILETV